MTINLMLLQNRCSKWITSTKVRQLLPLHLLDQLK